MAEEIYSVRPLLAVLIPWVSLFAVFLMPVTRPKLKKYIHIMGSVITFAVILSLFPDIMQGTKVGIFLIPGIGQTSFHLSIDGLGYYYGLVISFMWMLSTIYSHGYIEHRENRYYSFLALCNSFLLGCAFSQNMYTFFLFYELMTFAAYPLIIHDDSPESHRAGLKYLIYAISAGTVLFFAVIAHYYWGGGNLSLISNGTFNPGTMSPTVLYVIFFAYLVGFGVKASIMPLHGWVTDAHPIAPSPASALLSGVILKVGAFGIIRVVLNVYGLNLFRSLSLGVYLAAVAAVTIVVASILAISQDNLKKRLAFSSIGQVSYILLGLSLGTYAGVLGGLVQVAHHAIVKGCLFLCAGIIAKKTGKGNISEMAGIGYKMPVTMVCFTIAVLAMMGTPFTVGFVTKWLLGAGAIEGDNLIPIGVLIISALLNAIYFLPVVYKAFLNHPENETVPKILFRGESSYYMLAPVVILAALIIISGTFSEMTGLPLSQLTQALAHLMD
jgi:multicomponent Na+:H+ antiporter subunit D